MTFSQRLCIGSMLLGLFINNSYTTEFSHEYATLLIFAGFVGLMFSKSEEGAI
jgi:hypothetical protein